MKIIELKSTIIKLKNNNKLPKKKKNHGCMDSVVK